MCTCQGYRINEHLIPKENFMVLDEIDPVCIPAPAHSLRCRCVCNENKQCLKQRVIFSYFCLTCGIAHGRELPESVLDEVIKRANNHELGL